MHYSLTPSVSFRHNDVIDYRLFCHLSSITHHNWFALIHCDPDILSKSAAFLHYYYYFGKMQCLQRSDAHVQPNVICWHILDAFFVVGLFGLEIISFACCHSYPCTSSSSQQRREEGEWAESSTEKNRNSCIMYTKLVVCTLIYFIPCSSSHPGLIPSHYFVYVRLGLFRISHRVALHSEWTPVTVCASTLLFNTVRICVYLTKEYPVKFGMSSKRYRDFWISAHVWNLIWLHTAHGPFPSS